ncbi:LOW QUALITY PROTEIN: cadherin-16 [Cariama cristata]
MAQGPTGHQSLPTGVKPQHASTPNAELQYKILTQAPSQPSERIFQIDSRTAVSLSVEDYKISNYHLIVQVKDLGNQCLGYCALATVETAIMENTQVAPGAIFLPELLNVSYPPVISKREILAGNTDRLLYSDPLLLMTVMDKNDNLPVFEIITVKAENINDRKISNFKIAYEILSQKPQVSNGFSFHIGKEIQMISKEIGVITLQDYNLNTNAVKHYWSPCSSSSPLEWL